MLINNLFIDEINKNYVPDDAESQHGGLRYERHRVVIHYPVEQCGEDNGPDSYCPHFVVSPVTERGHAPAYFGYGHLIHPGIPVPKVSFTVPPHTAEDGDGDESQKYGSLVLQVFIEAESR